MQMHFVVAQYESSSSNHFLYKKIKNYCFFILIISYFS